MPLEINGIWERARSIAPQVTCICEAALISFLRRCGKLPPDPFELSRGKKCNTCGSSGRSIKVQMRISTKACDWGEEVEARKDMVGFLLCSIVCAGWLINFMLLINHCCIRMIFPGEISFFSLSVLAHRRFKFLPLLTKIDIRRTAFNLTIVQRCPYHFNYHCSPELDHGELYSWILQTTFVEELAV